MWIVSAVGLYILVSIFSSGTSDPNARWKILGIAIGSAVIQVYVTHLMPNLLGFLAALALSLGFIVAGLMLWLKVERTPALDRWELLCALRRTCGRFRSAAPRSAIAVAG